MNRYYAVSEDEYTDYEHTYPASTWDEAQDIADSNGWSLVYEIDIAKYEALLKFMQSIDSESSLH